MTAFLNVVGALGAAASGYINDFFGRRVTIIIATVVFIIGAGLQAGARSTHYLEAGRFVTGAGVGCLTTVVPLYQSEICHPRMRGRVTSFQQFFLGIGAFCASWIGYGCFTGLTEDARWRVPLGLQIVPTLFLGALIMFFPESPRWLASKGRQEEALRTLAKLHARGDASDPFVTAEFQAIKFAIEDEQMNSSSAIALFSSKSKFRRVLLAVGLQASVQMTGVSAIQYYSPQIFALMGISTTTTLLVQACNSIVALIAQFLCVLFLDRVGRRKPLIFGSLVNSAAFIWGAVMLAQGVTTTSSRGSQWAFIMSTWVFNASFSATNGPISWVYPTEIFDTAVRAKGAAFSTFFSYAFNTMIGQVTPIAIQNIGWKFFLLFVVCNITNAICFYLFFPETTKISLEKMTVMFDELPYIVIGQDTKKYRVVEHHLDAQGKEAEVEKDGTVAYIENV